MPRRRKVVDEEPRQSNGDLVGRLAAEMLSGHESGQPLIDEQQFASGKIRVTVIWDEWDRLSPEARTTVILRAYDQAEGRGNRDQIALATGLTVPEAYAAGMLPYQIITALRPGDTVTREQCRQALMDEGASTLLSPEMPQLRFTTAEEAEAARTRLAKRLPNSEPVWVITQDIGKIEHWAER